MNEEARLYIRPTEGGILLVLVSGDGPEVTLEHTSPEAYQQMVETMMDYGRKRWGLFDFDYDPTRPTR